MLLARSRTQFSCIQHRTQKTAVILRTLSLGAVLLITTLALGCADSIPTAFEEHVTPAADAAAAKKPATQTGVIRDTFPTNICGIDVAIEYFSAGATWSIGPGGVPEKETGIERWTLTAENGKSLQWQASGNETREIVEWIVPGKEFRATEIVTGAPLKLKSPHGPVLLLDVGRIVVEHHVLLLPDGGFTTEFTILEVSGPHPSIENPGLVCEIVTDTLT